MFVSTTSHCTPQRLARANTRRNRCHAINIGASRALHVQHSVSSANAYVPFSSWSQQQFSTLSSSCLNHIIRTGNNSVVSRFSGTDSSSRNTRAFGAMAAVILPANFEAVMGVVAASFFVHHIFMAFAVGKARRQYGVKYPDLYATKDNCPKEEDAKAFNCVQRGHQNSLENQPIFLSLLVCAGLKHPITAGIAGVVALIGRVLYFMGYSSGVPNNRLKGSLIGHLGVFVLLGTTLKSVIVWGTSLMA